MVTIGSGTKKAVAVFNFYLDGGREVCLVARVDAAEHTDGVSIARMCLTGGYAASPAHDLARFAANPVIVARSFLLFQSLQNPTVGDRRWDDLYLEHVGCRRQEPLLRLGAPLAAKSLQLLSVGVCHLARDNDAVCEILNLEARDVDDLLRAHGVCVYCLRGVMARAAMSPFNFLARRDSSRVSRRDMLS